MDDHHTLISIGQVSAAWGASFFVYLSHFNEIIVTATSILSFLFIVYKFYKEFASKKDKKSKKNI